MRYLIVLLVMLPGIGQSQSASSEANTKAACSAANTGTITTLTINCYGMSKERSEDMLRLMNRILSKQIDPKEVYKQLDQIQSTLAGFADVVNPLAKASSGDVALINDSQRLALSCSNFIQNWHIDFAKRQMAEVSSAEQPAQRAQPSTPVDWNEIIIEVDRKRAAEFRKSFATRIQVAAGQVIPNLPREGLPQIRVRELQNPIVKRMVDYGDIVSSLTIIYDQYNNPDIVSKPNPTLLASLKSLRQECLKFQQDWQAEYMKTGGVGAQAQSFDPSSLASLKKTFDAGRSVEFEKEVAPQLIAWRTKVLSRAPSLDSHVNYKNVSSTLDAGQVCADVMNTGNGYRSKVIDDLHNRTTR